jgi:hypothetical protein
MSGRIFVIYSVDYDINSYYFERQEHSLYDVFQIPDTDWVGQVILQYTSVKSPRQACHIINWASQTQIHNSQVCHMCEHATVCINYEKLFQQPNTCGCTVGKVISVRGCSVTA